MMRTVPVRGLSRSTQWHALSSLFLPVRVRLGAGLLGALLVGCGPALDLGSDVLWATDHESGSLADWYGAPGGGRLLDTPDGTVDIARGPAHSGSYSAQIVDSAKSDTAGVGLYRELVAPPDAYYSAWYFLPQSYQTISQWTIQQFRSRSAADPTQVSLGHDLNLRVLPGGQAILYVFSHDPAYLQSPLADPPAFVPVGRWFHVETLFRARTDETGEIAVWVDDHLVYDIKNRRTSFSDDVLWSVCNIAENVQPFPPVLYVDDAAISLRRVTNTGQPFAAGAISAPASGP